MKIEGLNTSLRAMFRRKCSATHFRDLRLVILACIALSISNDDYVVVRRSCQCLGMSMAASVNNVIVLYAS
jgi:hypothetical protein